MAGLPIKEMFNYSRLNVPTDTMCRNASRYLNSIINILPQNTQEFIRKFPYTSALILTLGADSITWVKSSKQGGDLILIEATNVNERDKGFPVSEIFESRIYVKEISLLAELGFNYELDYLKRNGFDVSDYEYSTPEESIKNNEVHHPNNVHETFRCPNIDNLATMYYFTKRDVDMLEDGYGHAPELLIEKMNILKEMLDILEICENDSCRSLTKFISEHDRLPGFVKLVVPAINCMSQEALGL